MNNINDKLPVNWKLFLFFILNFFHLILIFFVFYNDYFYALFAFELIFFMIHPGIKLKSIIRVSIVSLIIFIINLFFFEGKIIFQIGFIKFTEQGLLMSMNRSMLLFVLFLFSCNNISSKKNVILHLLFQYKKNIVLYSINYFFLFLNMIQDDFNLRKFILRSYRIYLYDRVTISVHDDANDKIFNKSYIVYKVLFLLISAAIIILNALIA